MGPAHCHASPWGREAKGNWTWSVIHKRTEPEYRHWGDSWERFGKESTGTKPVSAAHSDCLLWSLCWVLPAGDILNSQSVHCIHEYGIMSLLLLSNTKPFRVREWYPLSRWLPRVGVACGQRVCSQWSWIIRDHLLWAGPNHSFLEVQQFNPTKHCLSI